MNALEQMSSGLKSFVAALASELTNDVSGASVFEEGANGITLRIAVDDCGVITCAAHEGGRDSLETGTLELYCRCLPGMTLRDAADHAAVYALHAGLRHAQLDAGACGVVLPQSSGLPLLVPHRLLRRIAAAQVSVDKGVEGWNFDDPYPSPGWRSMSDSARKAKVTEAVSAFRGANRLADNDLTFEELQRVTRVIVSLSSDINYVDRGKILFDLERDLRGRTGERLEVLLEPRKDANKIRRL